MARAKAIAGLSPGMRFGTAAAAIVAVRADELFAHAEGVLDVDDIERVHGMRVATRRLRAVLEIFAPCFPRGAWGDVLRDVKGLADALGERRDPDVHIDALAAFCAAADPADREGVETLIARLREEQAAANTALAAALEEMERSELRARIDALLERTKGRPG